MALFFPRPTRRMREAKRLGNRAMRPGVIRWPLLIALCIVMVNVYWWHFDRRLMEIEAKSSFLDELGQWTASQREDLAVRARAFRDQWGMRVLVHVRAEALQLPELKGATLFVGVNPVKGQSMLALPGLASQALGHASREEGYDLRLKLERDLLACSQVKPSSAPCVLDTLDALAAIFNRH